MTLAGVEVPPAKIADAFAKFFQDKVLANSSKALIKDDVYKSLLSIQIDKYKMISILRVVYNAQRWLLRTVDCDVNKRIKATWCNYIFKKYKIALAICSIKIGC